MGWPVVATALGAASCSSATDPGGGANAGVAWDVSGDATNRLMISRNLVIVPGIVGSLTVVDPSTGRQKWRLPAPDGFGSVTLAGSVIVLVRVSGFAGHDYRVHDAETGALLYERIAAPARERTVATLGLSVIALSYDSVSTVVASARATGVELWRRTLPAGSCAPVCGVTEPLDELNGELTLAEQSAAAWRFVRVTANGTLASVTTAAPPQRSNGFTFATRTAVTDPIVAAGTRGVTSYDATNGAVRWQVRFDTLVPAGFYSFASRRQFTENGAYLIVQMIDSAGSAIRPVREIVLRTADGMRLRERDFAGEASTAWFDQPCNSGGRIRVFPNLTLEYTDVATGRISLGQKPVPELEVLFQYRSLGLEKPPVGTAKGHIIAYTPAGGLLAVRCGS